MYCVLCTAGALLTTIDMSSFTGGGFNVRLDVSDGQTKTGPYPLSVRVYGKFNNLSYNVWFRWPCMLFNI